jgi:hypothetical protein
LALQAIRCFRRQSLEALAVCRRWLAVAKKRSAGEQSYYPHDAKRRAQKRQDAEGRVRICSALGNVSTIFAGQVRGFPAHMLKLQIQTATARVL